MNTRELAAAYVLEELDAERRAEVEGRLPSDAELRAEVEAMRPLVATLGELPAGAWPGGLEEAPAPAAQPASVREPARPSRRQRRHWSLRPAIAFASLLAAVALGVGAGFLLDDGGGSEGGTEGPQLTLEGLAPTPEAHGLVAMPTGEDMVLEVSDLPTNPAGEYYELWLLGSDGETVPVASFRVGEGGTAKLRVPLPVDPGAYQYFDVSRQSAADGTQHSSDSVLRGPTSPS